MIPNYKSITEKINTFISKKAKQLGITQEALATKKEILISTFGQTNLTLEHGIRVFSVLVKPVERCLSI